MDAAEPEIILDNMQESSADQPSKLQESSAQQSDNIQVSSVDKPNNIQDSSGDQSQEHQRMDTCKPPQPGQASIKPEFLDLDHKKTMSEEYLPKEVTDLIKQGSDEETSEATNEPPQKRQKLKGRHKKRPIEKNPDAKDKICPAIIQERECTYGSRCKFTHDVMEYLANKPPDLGETCYLFDINGYCPYSYACRFASKHLTEDKKNVTNVELYEKRKDKKSILNVLDKEIQRKLWKKKYDFSLADKIWKPLKKSQAERSNSRQLINNAADRKRNSQSCDNLPGDNTSASVKPLTCGESADNGSLDENTNTAQVSYPSHSESGMKTSCDIISEPGRDSDKKKLDFSDKLYLAPLTTVGNLPFRRICKRYGADVTCSEMVLCPNLLQGQQSEWALLKRHETEDIFGAQLCGSFADVMTRCTQVISNSIDVDFIDINCGCPIDMVFKKGEGCALMSRTSRFETIVKSMTAMMTMPLTVKIRTGIYEDQNIAHTLIPRLRDWGVSLVTLHGRSREQRYTRLADWDYINQCAEVAKPMPLFGNGDILSYEDYEQNREKTGVAGAMIARGALIKPWLFTEIKERRHWDITSGERLDMLKDFANYGMEHWGSDQQGVTITRRFLLEWLSFLYRYIPVGVLERLPQRINEKPPYYFGRNDLETMMASPNCADWIKISEMVLGPVPEGFKFLPKHKANSYT